MGSQTKLTHPKWVIVIATLLVFSCAGPVWAEPSYGVSCAPPNPHPGCPPEPKVVNGQVSTGNARLYCTDANNNTISLMTDPSQVFFSVVELPPETVIAFVAVVAYYPSLEIVGYVNLPSTGTEPWTVITGGGPHQASSAVSFAATDPEGTYLRRAFVWYTDGATWKYAEPAASCPNWTYIQRETTTQGATTVVLTTTIVNGEQNPTTEKNPPIGAILGVLAAIVLLGLNIVIVLAGRRTRVRRLGTRKPIKHK